MFCLSIRKLQRENHSAFVLLLGIIFPSKHLSFEFLPCYGDGFVHYSDCSYSRSTSSSSLSGLTMHHHSAAYQVDACSDSSVDEDEINCRMKPFWPKYQAIFRQRGFQLDTRKDVRLFCNWDSDQDSQDDDSLCPDAGLPDNLFRGTRISDAKRIVVKAVHADSHEYHVIWTLSRPPLRDDPMNHTIPVLDIFEISDDDIAFIVMEEWSSQLITSTGPPCCLNSFLAALRQCIEHAVFMHRHHIAHLDISLRNILTDYMGHSAYIDYELSRHFGTTPPPHLVYNYRGTELPPESGQDTLVDPYKVDVWALAILILRACKLTGYWIPQLMHIINPMLNEDPSQRPSSFAILQAFDKLLVALGLQIVIDMCCYS